MKINFKIVGICLFCILLQNCKNSKVLDPIAKNISINDSVFVESELLAFKNVLFSELYNRSIEVARNKENIYCNDSIKDLSFYFYNNFNPAWINEDRNRENLLKKWLKHERYFPIAEPPDHPKGSLNIARALDFYNSDDLNKLLDSLRVIEYGRIKKITKR